MSSLAIKREEPLIEGYAEKAHANEGLVLSIAAELGARSIEALDRYGGMYRVDLPNDRAISLTFGRYGKEGGRVYASGSYPGHLGSLYYLRDKQDASASVAVSRGTATIVKEIRRRVLPGYEHNMKELEARALAEANAAVARDKVANSLGLILGREPRDRYGNGLSADSSASLSVNPSGLSLYGEFDVSPGGRVDIKLHSVPEDLAIELAGVVAKYIAEKGTK